MDIFKLSRNSSIASHYNSLLITPLMQYLAHCVQYGNQSMPALSFALTTLQYTVVPLLQLGNSNVNQMQYLFQLYWVSHPSISGVCNWCVHHFQQSTKWLQWTFKRTAHLTAAHTRAASCSLKLNTHTRKLILFRFLHSPTGVMAVHQGHHTTTSIEPQQEGYHTTTSIEPQQEVPST